MEIDYYEGIPEKELKVYRSFMNSKIDIFQNNDDYVFRGDPKTNKFMESYEHRQMQNNSARIISSASNMLVYSLAKGIESVGKTQHQLKQVFSKNIEEKEDLSQKHSEFKLKMMRKKLEKDNDYMQLCRFIESPRFHQEMISNANFLHYILYHKYFIYHPKYQEIKDKYKQFLCPVFSITNSNQDEMEEDN